MIPILVSTCIHSICHHLFLLMEKTCFAPVFVIHLTDPLPFQTQEVQKAMDEKKFEEAVKLRGR